MGEPEGGWWNWLCPEAASVPLEELMLLLRCDGLLDWSSVDPAALAEDYVQLIVSSGLGSDAMLHEGEADHDWLGALHRDVLCDCSTRGLRHLFYSKVDTIIVGVI